MKQTAVEWLEKRYDWTKGQLIQLDFDKAKAMEKEQIMNAHGDEQSHLQDDGSWRTATAEQYYNETFKSEL